eukprot:TRINITY_DN2181_c8_g1_i1.p1 TRINITY_DN2181_c8_g1~~TRINITY_DN2181_c8_g1_i1.p1  ORF type:complete len:1479 (+),score=337.71 TRINITY_DN2181_c8_g1_i1:40-4476(+)
MSGFPHGRVVEKVTARGGRVLSNGVQKVCVSQEGGVLWCYENGGRLVVRDSNSGKILVVVEKGIGNVRFLKAAGGLVWVHHTPNTLKAYDAWTFSLLACFTTSCLRLVPVLSSTALISQSGSITFLTQTLEEYTPEPPIPPVGYPTCCSPGGSYLFIGSGQGFVTVVSAAKFALKGKWVAHLNKSVEHIVCSQGFVATSSGPNVCVWDPFPNDGSGRLAVLLHKVNHHTHPLVSLSEVDTELVSLDTQGTMCFWSVTSPFNVRASVVAPDARHLVVSHGWQGLLVWSMCHDIVERHLKIYHPSARVLPDRFIQAQSHILARHVQTEQQAMQAPGRLKQAVSHHLSVVHAIQALQFLGRDCFRRWLLCVKSKKAIQTYSQGLQALLSKNRRMYWDKLARWKNEKKVRRLRVHAAFLSLMECSRQVMRRYFMMWCRVKVRKARLLRQLRFGSEYLEKTRKKMLLTMYYSKLVWLVNKSRSKAPKSRAAQTLLRCTIHGTILGVYRKWKKFTTMRGIQRNMVDNNLSRSAQHVRLIYFNKLRRWAIKHQHKSRLEDFMSTLGDLGILHTYYRKLKMYGGWSAMVEMNAMQEAAAKYFHELVDEEKQLLGEIVEVSGSSWPACAITSALGMNIEKWMKEGMVFFAGESQEYVGMKMVAEKLQEAWGNKGDIFDELSENLVAPPGVNKEALLWQLCVDLHKKYGKVFKDRQVGPVEILAMRLYTLEGPDVDRHMGFGDVPPPFSSVPDSKKETLMAQWDAYKKLHLSVSKPTVSKVHNNNQTQGDRNPSIYGEMNKALRTSTDIAKWAKLSSLLLALSMPIEGAEDASPTNSKMLYRGIHNLPDSVMSAHRGLQRGWSYAWLAPSSTSENMKASEDFLKTTDKKYNILFKVSGCNEGLPLHKVSQFPDEAEVLLPPFSTFVVESEPVQCENYLEISLRFKGTLVQQDQQLDEFINDVREEASYAAERRYNLQSTRQLQEVEQSARKFNMMERDLIMERMWAIHIRTAKKTRVHDLERRKYEALLNIRKRQSQIKYKNALAEKWRPSEKSNELHSVITHLKSIGVLSFAEDSSLINKLTTAFATKKPLIVAKEAYNAIKSTVTMYAKGTKKKGELWPAACVRRMTALDIKKCVTAYKTLVIASDYLSKQDYNDLLTVVERPLGSLPAVFKALNGKAPISPFSTPTSSFRNRKGSGGFASVTFNSSDARVSPTSSPPTSTPSSPHYVRSRTPSIAVSLSPSHTPCGSPIVSPHHRRTSNGYPPMTPVTPLEDYLQASPRRLRRRYSDVLKVCYDPLQDDLVRELEEVEVPEDEQRGAEEEAAARAEAMQKATHATQKAINIEVEQQSVSCDSEKKMDVSDTESGSAEEDPVKYQDDSGLVARLEERRPSMLTVEGSDASLSEESVSEPEQEVITQAAETVDSEQEHQALEEPQPVVPPEASPTSSASPQSRRDSLERAAGDAGAAIATSALFSIKGLMSLYHGGP